ncbi:MAG: hypothetical protein LBU16_05920 [Treponema sp.]|jgi:hypothetical protein|nr:hypothetical protein [Treponema sp.]
MSIRIGLAVSAEEVMAIGRDLAYIKVEKDRKIIQPLTYRFLVKVFKEAKTSSLNAYLQGKNILNALGETQFEP